MTPQEKEQRMTVLIAALRYRVYIRSPGSKKRLNDFVRQCADARLKRSEVFAKIDEVVRTLKTHSPEELGLNEEGTS